jgi:hypothetical protein
MDRMLAALRGSGDTFEDLGDGWYAIRDDVFLYLTEADLAANVADTPAAAVDGLWPDASLDEARFRLTSINLEETLDSEHGGIRYVVVDGPQTRVFDTAEPEPLDLPPGEYEWRAWP